MVQSFIRINVVQGYGVKLEGAVLSPQPYFIKRDDKTKKQDMKSKQEDKINSMKALVLIIKMHRHKYLVIKRHINLLIHSHTLIAF